MVVSQVALHVALEQGDEWTAVDALAGRALWQEQAGSDSNPPTCHRANLTSMTHPNPHVTHPNPHPNCAKMDPTALDPTALDWAARELS